MRVIAGSVIQRTNQIRAELFENGCDAVVEVDEAASGFLCSLSGPKSPVFSNSRQASRFVEVIAGDGGADYGRRSFGAGFGDELPQVPAVGMDGFMLASGR